MRTRKQTLLCVLAVVCFVLGGSMLTVFTAVRFTGLLLCCAGAVLLLFAALDRWRERTWAVWCRRGLWALLAAGFCLFFAMEAWVLRWSVTDETTSANAIVVFGAGVNGTVPSLSLRVRLEAALEYAQTHPGIPIVVSGARGAGEDVTEAQCMADWLTAHGVEPDRLLLEEQAVNTRQNVDFSLALLAEQGVDPAGRIAFVTADYHLCRAIWLRGGENVVPVAAHMPRRYWPITVNYYIREAFAMARLVVLPSA